MKKVISYLGFAIKSNNVVVGQTLLKSYDKKLNLILVCKTASENLIELAKNVSKKQDCPLIITSEKLEDLTHMPNVKILGVIDVNLSKAIYENKEKISID